MPSPCVVPVEASKLLKYLTALRIEIRKTQSERNLEFCEELRDKISYEFKEFTRKFPQQYPEFVEDVEELLKTTSENV